MPVHCIETVRNGAQASAFTNVVGLLGSVCCAGCVCAHAIAKVAKSAIEGVCNFRFFFGGGNVQNEIYEFAKQSKRPPSSSTMTSAQ